MPARAHNLLDWLLGIIDGLAARWTRARQLDYRRRVRAAAARGDQDFLRRQVELNQLTAQDLRKLRKHHTPAEQWPDQPDDLFAPVTQPVTQEETTGRP